jgi:hypothetical protein
VLAALVAVAGVQAVVVVQAAVAAAEVVVAPKQETRLTFLLAFRL